MDILEKCSNHDRAQAYLQENQIVADNILENLFFKPWKDETHPLSFHGIELIISPKCNLACKYCYYNKYHKILYPDDNFNEEQVKQNLKLILQWLDYNHYRTNLDIFSGEFFAQTLGWECLDIIYNYEKTVNSQWRITDIMIPTNLSFCANEELAKKIFQYKEKFDTLAINLYLSASFDGLYEDPINRPVKCDLDFPLSHKYNEDYYNKCFQFVYDYYAGLHPMIYSKGIDQWIKNFTWFQDAMHKNDIWWQDLYLLEVRNEDWNQDNLKDFMQFYMYLFDWIYTKFNGDKTQILEFIFQNGFNILSGPFSTTERGYTCSIQTNLMIRVGDLKLVPCHRTAYPHLILGTFEPTNDEQVLKFRCENAELLTTIFSMHRHNNPYCIHCPINHLCGGQCLGACYENNYNIFGTIPSVCLIEYAKIIITIQALLKYNLYTDCLATVTEEQRIQLEFIRKELLSIYDKTRINPVERS